MNTSTRTGTGLSYRRRYHQQLLTLDTQQRPDVLEIVPEHFFGRERAFEQISSKYPIIFHDIGLSLPTVPSTQNIHAFERQHLAQLDTLLQLQRPLLFTEHLALTHAPCGLDIGHLAPVWYTEDSLQIVSQRVQRLQEHLKLPIALENVTCPFQIPLAEMSEAEFFHRLVEITGCNMLLDLTNLLYNARNFQFDPLEELQRYPLESVAVVHLAGGFQEDQWWIDSHSKPVEQDTFNLLKVLRQRATPCAIFIERDDEYPPLDTLLREAQHAKQLWESTS